MAKRYHKSKKGGMISNDSSKFANIPTEVVMKEYPKTSYHGDPGLNDTISGIDSQMGSDTHAGAVKSGNSEKF